MGKPKAVITVLDSLLSRAVSYSNTHWYQKATAKDKQELSRYQDELFEYDNSLNNAIENDDFNLQNILETKILNFKNEVDHSQVIQQYLIQSKYTELQFVGYGNAEQDFYIEQRLEKTLKESREQIFEQVEKDLTRKYQEKYELDAQNNIKTADKENKAKFINQIEDLGTELSASKNEIEQLKAKQSQDEELISELMSQRQKIIEECKSEVAQYKSVIIDLENQLLLNKKNIENLKKQSGVNATEININMGHKPHKFIEFLSKLNKVKCVKKLCIEKAPMKDLELKEVIENNL